jgi:hypothetical protein
MTPSQLHDLTTNGHAGEAPDPPQGEHVPPPHTQDGPPPHTPLPPTEPEHHSTRGLAAKGTALLIGGAAAGAAGGFVAGKRAAGSRASAPVRQVRRWRRRAGRKAAIAGAKRAPRAAWTVGRHVRVR